jgi:peptide/nickel transport system substrate-binding protein
MGVGAPREGELEGGLADPRAPWEELVEDPEAPRALLAVMFTDIVASTELATTLGDKRWRELLEQQEAAVRAQIARFGGREIDTAGDAFFVTFDLPVRAVDCALESIRAARRLGLRIRGGVHMGECVVTEGKVRGVTVHIGARVGSKASGGEVLVSSTVRELLAGAGLTFRDRGEHHLKGVEGRWRLYAAEPRTRDVEADLPPLLEAHVAGPPKPAWRRPRVLVAAATALALLIATVAYVTVRGPGGLSSVPADSVAVINARSGAVESAVAVRRRPVGMAATPDGIWVANSVDRSVTHVSESGGTETIPVGPGPIAVAAGGGFIWVANADASSVSRVSPETGGEVGERIQVGNGLSAIAYGANALWVANSVDGTVWRVDPSSGRKTLEVQVGPALRGLAVTDDAVWVTSETSGTLTRIDPGTGVIVRVVRVGNGPVALGVDVGAVWVANGPDNTVARVDVSSGDITATEPVGRAPRSVAIAGGRVFVANEEDGTVSMLDAASGKAIRTTPLLNSPMGLAASGDRVWVSVRGGILRYRGGTLRFGTIQLPQTIDPSISFDPVLTQLMTPAVFDGLTAFKRVGGPEGNELVPNLAEDIRPPTDGGTTYSFTLRPGLKYSDGTPVRASDVRTTFERILRHGDVAYGAVFLTIINGSESCTQGKECDLSAGVITDDRAGTVVFHLRKPLADFPYQLALPSLVIVPGNAPQEDAGLTPIPGTGPYRIDRAEIERDEKGDPTRGMIVLARNPHFEPRGLAQPDGYPDRIEISMGGTGADHVAAVKEGREDLMVDISEPDVSIEQLSTEIPAQVQLIDMPWTAFLALNATVSPFNDVRARQALNYAIDRRALTTATRNPLLGGPSCQVLPKNTVGYIPYCPYTKDPNDLGQWTGPDLQKARQLVAASGTAGQEVTIWIQRGDSPPAQARRARAPIVASALRSIGYRPTIQPVPGDDYFGPLIDPKSRYQIAITGWFSDYPAASNFVLPLLTCKQTLDRLAGMDALFGNMSHFCMPQIDAMTERALAVQQEDPAAARDRWAEVDRALTDAAGLVPFTSLRTAAVVSGRVGNVQGHPAYLWLLTQMWVTEPGTPSP